MGQETEQQFFAELQPGKPSFRFEGPLCWLGRLPVSHHAGRAAALLAAGIHTPMCCLFVNPAAQVFVGGEFIGGADIVEQMNGSGGPPELPAPHL